MNLSPRLRFASSGVISLTLVAVFTTLAQPKQDPKSTPSSVAPPSQVPAKTTYVSSATCTLCHEDLAAQFLRTPHQLLERDARRGWKDLSCEACHGPGEAHVNAGDGTQIVAFSEADAQETRASCLTCHAGTESLAGHWTSLHGKTELACTQCHQIHQAGQPVHLLADRPTQICTSCHRETLSAFSKPFRHRLHEEAISCVDCHHPHGGMMPRQMQVAHGNEEACVKCHTDKRGPFAFEHAATRLQGCIGCHEPHGSVNPKMLIRHQQQYLCLECHSLAPGILGGQPPAFHDLRSARFQNCTTCHLKIHGSHVNRFLLR